jgi:hypothetical protein
MEEGELYYIGPLHMGVGPMLWGLAHCYGGWPIAMGVGPLHMGVALLNSTLSFRHLASCIARACLSKQQQNHGAPMVALPGTIARCAASWVYG